MHLIQLLLPLRANDGAPFAEGLFREVLGELTDRFGGSTAYTRSPAEGKWKSGEADHHDDIVVVEVMAERLDHAWWGGYRRDLERRFRQLEIVIRAQAIEKL